MDTFTQPKIIGYRQLNQEEANLMNEVKALALACGELVAKLESYPPEGRPNGSGDPQVSHRWIAIGRTELQQGFMALIRSIAKPETF